MTIVREAMGDTPDAVREAVNANWDAHCKEAFSRYELRKGKYVPVGPVKE
jgi:hypothetical protein